MKKFLVFLLFILLIGAGLFTAGWVQLFIPPGHYAVMVSKTGGTEPVIIEPGIITWKWQRLIPTNTSLIPFNLRPVSVSLQTSGSLPSAELYTKMLEGRPDFSWQTSVRLSAAIDIDSLPALVRTGKIQNEDELNAWIAEETRFAVKTALTDRVLEIRDPAAFGPVELNSTLFNLVQRSMPEAIRLTDLIIENWKYPDMDLYLLARQTYRSYVTEKQRAVSTIISEQVEAASTDYLRLERFAQIGEILTKYPVLIDYLEVSRGTDPLQPSIRSAR